MNINLDQQTLEACLKQINNIGSTTYQNICTGEIKVVPWGSSDWLSTIFPPIIILCLTIFLGYYVFSAVTSFRR